MNYWPVTRENFARLNKETKFMDQKDFMREAYRYQVSAISM